MIKARRLVRQHYGRDHGPLLQILARIFVTIAWPPAVLLNLWQIRRNLQDAKRMRRASGAFWAAMRHNVEPGEYFGYELWRPERKANIDNYLYQKEGPRLFKLLNQVSMSNPIDDKLAFFELCKANAIPTPEVLAIFFPSCNPSLVEVKLPEIDLFIKPQLGRGSEGTERFRWRDARFESNRGYRLSPVELATHLAQRAQTENRALLVQPNLANHPAFQFDPDAALATVRLITGMSINSDVSSICAFINFALSEHRTAARFASVAVIDLQTGKLTCNPRQLHKTSRPIQCNLVIHSQLPDWQLATRYAETAHKLCSSHVFIGWDIAFSKEGPVLLEGNTNWGASEYQWLHGEPLGLTKFAEILATRLCKIS